MLTVRQLIASLATVYPARLDTPVVVEIDGHTLPLRSTNDTRFESVPGADTGVVVLRLSTAHQGVGADASPPQLEHRQ